MAKKPQMTKEELAALCQSLFEQSRNITEISEEREESLRAYNSDPYGNEAPGFATFVTSDVRDVIEWTLPNLMDMFWSPDLPVVFIPENADDVKQADTETRYCANVVMNQNEDGFIDVYSWFKDALMQKNGVMKVWWDEREEIEREEYRGKSLEDYMALSIDEEFDITEVTFFVGGNEYDEEEYAELLTVFTVSEALMEVQTATLIDIVGNRRRDVSQIRFGAVAPENFFVIPDHNSVSPKHASYCCEFYKKTRSDLVEEGYPQALVDELGCDYDGLVEFGMEAVTRNEQSGQTITVGNSDAGLGVVNKSREELAIFDHYIRVDFDGDGISELRLVRTNGPGGEVLENEPVDRNIYHCLTPYINTHEHYGRSLADNMMDLQALKTQVVRSMLDSLTYSVVPRKRVKGTVNIDDLLNHTPGGIIRMGADGEVENDITEFVGANGISVLELINGFRAERSGFSKESMGLDPKALSNSTNLVGAQILAQQQLLLKMIASIFANTGFKSFMLHIRELVAKYEKKPRIFEVTGQYLETDPREWRKQRHSTAKTGIGFAAKAEKLAALGQFLDLQKEIAVANGSLEGPVTSNQGFYALIGDIGRTIGVVDAAQKYFRDPATFTPPPTPPSLADMTFKLQRDKAANELKQSEAKKVQDQTQFNQKMAWEKEQFEITQDWEEEKFYREMIFKYGEQARESLREFLASDRADKADERKARVEAARSKKPEEEEEQEDGTDESGEGAAGADAADQPGV